MRHHRERVTMALDTLVAGLPSFVERQLQAVYGENWQRAARGSFRDDRGRNGQTDGSVRWDAHSLLTIMWDQWNRAFRHSLGHCERSLVSELREYRNQWAHQVEFRFDDTYRLLDSVERLLRAVGSPLAKRVRREKHDLMRSEFIRQAKAAYARTQLRKRAWQDLAVYLTCGIALVAVILQFFGLQAWVFAAFVIFVFAYLSYQRLNSHPPLVFGPHECGVCRRIIYGESCPYCETATGESKRSPEENPDMIETEPLPGTGRENSAESPPANSAENDSRRKRNVSRESPAGKEKGPGSQPPVSAVPSGVRSGAE